MDVLELTRALVRMDTTNPPGNEDPAIDLVQSILSGSGFKTRRHQFAPGRSNLIAVGRSKHSIDAPIAFTGHVDTVPLGQAAWSQEPFGCAEHNGRIYGRGVTDMKAGVAAFVTAAAALQKNGKNVRDVVLVITGGEERGCEGAQALRRDGIVLPPISNWVVAEPTSNRIALGHKGAVFVDVEWTGKTAHSAMPEEGDNAIYRACAAALRIRDMPLQAPVHPVLGKPTRNVGILQGGQAPNAVPDRAWLCTDVRTVPGMNNQAIVEQIRNLAGDKSTLTIRYDLPAIWTDSSDPLVQRSSAALRASGIVQHSFIGMPFFTDASVLAAMAPAPTIIIGPGEPTQAHKTDEWCPVSDIHQAVEIYTRLIGT